MNKAPAYFDELYVMLTEYCPLRCPYCYIKERDNPATITVDRIKKALDLFQRPPKLIFFGGEPLTRIDLMKETVAVCADKVGRFQVVTSGHVNMDRYLREVHGPHFDLQVSWDMIGDKWNLPDLGVPYQARCVINDANVDRVPEIYDIFNSVKPRGITGDMVIAHAAQRRPDYAPILARGIEYILRGIEEGGYIPQFIHQYIANVITGQPHTSCDAGRYLVVRPNGDLYPCTILSQTEWGRLGNLDGEIDFEVMEELRYVPAGCEECEARGICDGGCRYERLINFGDLEKNCGHNCNNMRVIFDVIRGWYHALPNKDEMAAKILRHQGMWIEYQTGNLEKYRLIRQEVEHDNLVAREGLQPCEG